MRYRILGRTGLRVSEIGLGARTMGRNTDDQESLRALNRALDLGINFFDTSDKYQGSEEVVAQVLKTRRQEIILATKGGQIRRNVFEPSPAYLTECLEGSLRRLQIDTIDLYQLHQAGPDAMKRSDMWELLDRWKQEGKIRYYGVSLADGVDGVPAIQCGKPDTLQVVYNIFHQELEDELFPLALKNNVGIIARVPLERGLLTGKFTNYATDIVGDAVRGDRFTPEEFQKVSAAVEKLRFLVKGDVENLGEAALRFVLSHPAVSMAIPGMQKVARVEENVKASQGSLPPEDLARLRQLYQTEFRHLDFH